MARIQLDGGDSEDMKISGVCSKTSYKFDKDYIEYNSRVRIKYVISCGKTVLDIYLCIRRPHYENSL